jgi:hypothetical protein
MSMTGCCQTAFALLRARPASWGGSGNDFAADLDQSGAGHYRAVFDADNNFQSATSQTVFVPASA